MNIDFRDTAVAKWREYFPQAEMPIAVNYSDELCGAEYAPAPPRSKRGYVCLFAQSSSFDNTRIDNVIVPFGSGCEQMLTFSFAAPMFERMIDNMDRTFLTTYIWKPLMSR